MPCPAGPESNPHALSCRLGLERLPPPFVNAVRLFLLDVTGALAVSKPLLCPDPCPSSNPCMARTITTVVAVAICPVRTVPYSSEPVTACVPLTNLDQLFQLLRTFLSGVCIFEFKYSRWLKQHIRHSNDITRFDHTWSGFFFKTSLYDDFRLFEKRRFFSAA
ncbi:hypothetical protein HZ326_4416 [Fusarium oxysporum f. sp. albedinis]|nr:hypothetical protein HZ326_4416 [Fusarium oxysporum f. sp. albedinis]